MFQRIAVKGPGLLLGLMAALLPASNARAAGPAKITGKVVGRRTTAVTAPPTKAAPRGSTASARKPAAVWQRPPAPRTTPAAKPAAPVTTKKPRGTQAGKGPIITADQSWLPAAFRRADWIQKLTTERRAGLKARKPGPATHGGGPYDFNLDGGDPPNQIEPSFFPDDSAYFALSSDRLGRDNYPGSTDGTPNPPDFLQANDYHLYVSTAGLDRHIVRIGVFSNFGEQFEPNVGKDQRLVFSAFLPLADSNYKPDTVPDTSTCKDADGNTVTFDDPGSPVRVIAVSDDAIGKAIADDQTDATITKVLIPQVFDCASTTTGEGDQQTTTYRPILVPDASPVWVPEAKSNLVYFVSLRGYKTDDPTTHYTSLWVWDVEAELSEPDPRIGTVGNPHQVLKIDGQSILFPSISQDGRFIAFTTADIAYEPLASGELPDIVWDFDVTKDALKKPFKARVQVAPLNGNSVGDPIQATAFTDPETQAESRDIMPFWSPLNQLGFSTDRLDTDGNDIADKVGADPATALWDIYTIPFPINMQLLQETLPDTTARRRTLGPADVDDSNELRGSWGPINTQTSALGSLQPWIIYQADDAGNWDIWTTDLTVATAPNGNILQGLPVVTGNPSLDDATKKELLQTHRVGMPGDFVNISVNVNPDYITKDDQGAPDYANTQVYVTLKDPDPIDPNFFFDQTYISYDVNNGIPLHVYTQLQSGIPIELIQEDLDLYIQNFGDKPDAPKMTMVGTVQMDPVAGSPGRYSVNVFTPAEASDYLLDVVVIRQVPGPGGTPVPDGYYTDNIGGFSTAPFVPLSRMLLVSDFTAGQKVIPFTTHTLLSTIWPVESYLTWRQRPFRTSQDTPLPIRSRVGPYAANYSSPWATIGPLYEFQSAPQLLDNTDPRNPRIELGQGGSLTNNPLSSVVSPFANSYDLWRVQCREPILYDDLKDTQGNVVQYGVMKNYLPYLITQPGYPVRSQARTQRIADRCIVWAAPYAGQLNGNSGTNSTAGFGGINNLGMGTVANVKTQNEILKFMTPQPATGTTAAREAGRLAMTGATIASTLTAEGGANNPLLARFSVDFESPYDANVINGVESSRDELKNSRDGIGVNPIAFETWAYQALPHIRDEALPNDIELAPYEVWVPFYEGQQMYITGRRIPPTPTWEDAAWNQLYISSVTAIGNGQLIWNYSKSDVSAPAPNTGVAAVQSENPRGANENTSSFKSLYFAFGLEGVNRYYYPGPDNDVRSPDRPAEIFHNINDYMTTGGFLGQVFVNNNVAQSQNVLVYAVDVFSPDGVGKIKGTAVTDNSGTYYMPGLDTGVYQLFAYRAGTSTAVQNPVIQPIDTGIDVTSGYDGITLANLYLVSAQPGTLRGVITDQETGKPVEGVTVRIQEVQGPDVRETTTNANGEYVFTSVPKGLYIVTVPEQAGIVDGTSYNFMLFVTPETNPLAVTTDLYENDPRGDTVFNITLNRRPVAPEPATLEVTVYDDSSGTPAPAVGATVTVTDATTGEQVAVLEGSPSPNPGTTGDDGKVTFKIKAAQVIVTVNYGTSKPATKSLLVQPDATNPNGKTTAVFHLGGVVHVFPAGSILMASAPYAYTGTTSSPLTFSAVLNLTDAQLKDAIVAYDSTAQSFVFYPTYPADTFRPGVGYGFKLPADGRVMEVGDLVSATNNYYVVRANIGWNLIGNPFPGEVAWSKANANGGPNVKFALRDDQTGTLHDIGDTNDTTSTSVMLTGDIAWGGTTTDQYGNGVYQGTYAKQTIIKPWQSYWVKVAQPVLFYFPRTTAPEGTSLRAGADASATRTTILPGATTWGLDITAATGTMADRGLGLGLSRNATIGADAGLDLAKPSPMNAAGPMLFTAFVQPNGEFRATDVRPVGTNDWTFIVNTNLNARDITLSWTPSGRLPAGTTLVLVDTATGVRTNMGTTNRYTFRSARGGGIRQFRVELRGASLGRTR